MTAPTKNVVDLATASTLAAADKVLMVDISDTTEGPLGTVKIATITSLSAFFDVISAQGLTSVNNNGLVYVNSGGALTSGAGIQSSDGTNLIIGAASARASSLLDVRGNITVGANATYYGTLSYNAGTGAFDSRSEDGVFTWTKAVGNAIQATLNPSGSDGYFRLASGGIQFNGDTAAANALDDYEEGTWTPTVGGTATYIAQDGYYTKIGNFVKIRFRLNVDLIGTGSATTISGIPFNASNNSPSIVGGVVCYVANLATSALCLGIYAQGGSINFFSRNANDTSATVQLPAVIGNGFHVFAEISYMV